MSQSLDEKLLHEAVRASSDANHLLQDVFAGFVREKGGPDAWGKELAKLTEDREYSSASQVSIHSAMLRLAAQLSGGESSSELLSVEQMVARIRQIDKQIAGAGDGQ